LVLCQLHGSQPAALGSAALAQSQILRANPVEAPVSRETDLDPTAVWCEIQMDTAEISRNQGNMSNCSF